MTTLKSNVLTSHLGQPMRNRIALALSHAISDSRVRPGVVPFGSVKLTDEPTWFQTLLQQEGCQAAWTAYTDVTTPTAFPQQLAKGAAPLNGFRHYTIQDAIYLEYYVRVRMEAIGTWDSNVSSEDLWNFVATIPDGLNYSKNTISVCENQLGVPAAVVQDEWQNRKSQELQTSIRNYESVIANAMTGKGNSWLDIHIALLPCIKGYYQIAVDLLQDPTTIRNTLYYTLWIQGNADPTYVEEYETFITNNIGTPTQDQWAHYGALFKQACENEMNFFNLAIKDYPSYGIVDNGNYTISPYVNGKEFLAANGQEVVISSQSTLWQLTDSADGYAIMLGEQYLGYNGQSVLITSEAFKWSINPVIIPGNSTYQLFLSTTIQLALDLTGTTVSVAKNDPTSQTWILTLNK